MHVADAELPAVPRAELRAFLRQPFRSGSGLAWVIVTGILVVNGLGMSLPVLGTYLGALLFHELGHLGMMKAFGYKDVRIFFLPIFGSSVPGDRGEASGAGEALVVLAGPVPGIVLAAALLVAAPEAALSSLAIVLGFNAFHLLPLDPLDGGKFLAVTLFRRVPILETVFVALGALALVGLSLALHAWILLAVTVLGLFALPRRHAVTMRAAELRREGHVVDGPYGEASDAVLDAAWAKASIIQPGADPKGVVRPTLVRDLLDRLAQREPPPLATVGLLAFYGFAWVAVVAGFVAFALRSPDMRPDGPPGASSAPAASSSTP